MKTGRPIENPAARYGRKPSIQIPGPVGAHNWQPMAFDPETGLVYIPVIDSNFIYAQQRTLAYTPGAWNVSDFAQLGQMIQAGIQKGIMPAPAQGFIRAWDPVAQKMVWQVPMTGGWNSGMLATAGGLVFAGGSDGIFAAYDAKTGSRALVDRREDRHHRTRDHLHGRRRAICRGRRSLRRIGRSWRDERSQHRAAKVAQQSGAHLRLQDRRHRDSTADSTGATRNSSAAAG